MNDFKEWLSDYLRYFLLGFAILAVLIIAGGGIVLYKKLADPAPSTQTPDTVNVETENTGGQGDGTESTEPNNPESETKPASEPTTEKETDSEASSETGTESENTTEGTTGSSETGESEESSRYLKVTTTLNFRSEPNGEILTTYSAGRIVKFLSQEGDWYKVRVGGRDGYMSSAYLEEVPYEAGMEAEVETEKEDGTTAQSELIYKTLKGTCYLREETSKDSRILGTYNAGATVQFLEDVGGWYRVQVDGMTGYMGAQFF